MQLIEEIIFPRNWQEFVELKDKIPFFVPELARFPEDLFFYKLYSKHVSKEIRFNILNQQIGDSQIKIVKNAFPYLRLIQNLSNVEHYCLWSRNGSLSSEVIESEIKKQFPIQEYFWFENIDEIKSIPEIWHCQIFIKLK